MIIWFALLIPVITAIVLFVCFQRKVTWWELFIPLLASLALITICMALTEYGQTRDTEYWSGWVVKGEYNEHWNELHEWDETYTEEEGSGKNKRTVTKTRHRSEVIDHPAYWQVTDSNGITITIDKSHWEELSKRFTSRKLTGHHLGHTISGNIYETAWPGNEETKEVVSTSHSYTNRVLASESVFNFRKIDKEEKERYGIFDYPPIEGLRQRCILGADDFKAERKLQLLNAKFGKPKQIRVWILVYKDQPMDAAVAQESYWVGGNKNELCLCIGVNGDNEIQWGYVFSWTEKEMLKVECRDLITNQKKLDLGTMVDKLDPLIETGWERKHFKDFNYLHIEPPMWAVIMTYILTIAANVGISFWIVNNEYTNESKFKERPPIKALWRKK